MEKVLSNPRSIPVALSVAGSDSCAGAGVQADLKTFSALGVYGLTAVTCSVSEVPGMVAGIEPASPRHLRSQIALALEHYPVSAVKTGMFPTAEHVGVLVECLDGLGWEGALVVDPVMVASSGADLASEKAVAAMTDLLLPRASVVTPNLGEAGKLVGYTISSRDAMEKAAQELMAQWGSAVVLKGGHLDDGESSADVLVEETGRVVWLEGERLEGLDVHGTGCTFASAIAGGLASNLSLEESVREAKRFVAGAMREAFDWNDVQALNHFHTEERGSHD